MELSSARVTMTPSPTEYGSDRSYLAWRSGVDRDLVGDHVEPVGLQRGEDRIPGGLDEFDFDAELFADGRGDVDVVADELPLLGRDN